MFRHATTPEVFITRVIADDPDPVAGHEHALDEDACMELSFAGAFRGVGDLGDMDHAEEQIARDT